MPSSFTVPGTLWWARNWRQETAMDSCGLCLDCM